MILFFKDRSIKIALLILAGTLANVAFADEPAASAAPATPAAAPAASTTPDDAAKAVKPAKKITAKNSVANSPKELTPVKPQPEPSFWENFNPKKASFFLQFGGFGASQGNEQGVRINGLVGDYYTMSSHYSQNVLVGAGYYIPGFQNHLVSFLYGVNIFYFPNTTVKGSITQEQLFTNLDYKYSLVNVPVYAGIKALLNTGSSRYHLSVDVGVGPNTIRSSGFSQTSLDGGETLPDAETFSGVTSVALSAMAGLGVRWDNVFQQYPLEINYRFFYLGQSNFNTVNNQIKTTLHTGNSYANAFFFTLKM